MVLLRADNTTAEVWAQKGSKRSFLGRALGLLQCALMINNPVGINVSHVSTTDNVVADRISRIIKESNLETEMNTLMQDFPQLICCRRFQPSAEAISLIMEILSSKKYVDPLEVSRRLLKNPGEFTT